MAYRIALTTVVLTLAVNAPAQAVSNKTWDDLSTVGSVGLMGVALATPSLRGDWAGTGQAGLSLALAGGVATLGKAVIHEQRPDRSDNNSFPSGHTALAFASATTLYRRYGWEMGFPAYAVATFTGAARVAARKHHWYDVVVGGAVGTGSGWLFTKPFNDKVQLIPWADSKGGGLWVATQW
jgi:membrane-associated phospholipid phosphatase